MDGAGNAAGPRVSRRQALAGAGVVTGLIGVGAGGVLLSQTPPSPAVALAVDAATTDELVALSAHLCGGGTFDPDRARELLALLAADPTLSRGFLDLRLDPPAAGTANPQSAAATATSRAILTYWYAGAFNGAPVANRAATYDQLLAWQAMYTFPFATCKGFGEWANAPDDQPIGDQNLT